MYRLFNLSNCEGEKALLRYQCLFEIVLTVEVPSYLTVEGFVVISILRNKQNQYVMVLKSMQTRKLKYCCYIYHQLNDKVAII